MLLTGERQCARHLQDCACDLGLVGDETSSIALKHGEYLRSWVCASQYWERKDTQAVGTRVHVHVSAFGEVYVLFFFTTVSSICGCIPRVWWDYVEQRIVLQHNWDVVAGESQSTLPLTVVLSLNELEFCALRKWSSVGAELRENCIVKTSGVKKISRHSSA